ncbi:MAG: hypothetical protein MUF35_00875 [Candidatus Nanopelagicales bacterium]|jgi:hypothetical protein|nr:hypothetical protein [Candidatus Nanopelagicales bacterium]
MSLLDDLTSLDLSLAVEGQVDLRDVLDAPALRDLLEGGAATSVLGDLGTVLAAARAGFDDPAALVAPIAEQLTGVLDAVGLDDLPLAEYVEAVTAGARVVAGLVEGLAGDPRALAAGGTSLGDLLDGAGGPFADHARAVSSGMSQFRALVETVEGGLPEDPVELLGPALQILLPFPTAGIDAVRAWAGAVTVRLDAITVDPRLTEGLVRALDEVRLAAEAGDVARVRAALLVVAQVRASTVGQLADALRRAAAALAGLGVEQGLDSVRELRGLLAGADDTALDLLAGWRATLAEFRGTVEDIDPAVAVARFGELLDLAEARATEVLLGAVDEAVAAVTRALRDLLRELPLRPLRQQLGDAIAAVAAAIDDADLDAPVAAIRDQLAQLSGVLVEADPAALVQAAVGELEDVLRTAIDAIEQALGKVTDGIDAVAGQAEQVLGRAVAGLQEFRGVVDRITAAIEDAGILQAAEEIAAALQDLRAQVTELLQDAPLPEPLRASVEQLVALVESIDVEEAVGRPLREVAARLAIPDDVATTVGDGLRAVADAVHALVPTQVIADLEAAMAGFLDEVEHLDLTQLTAGITDVVDDAAAVFEGIDLVALVEPAGAVHDQVLAAVDRLHPRTLLAPVIRAHAELLGALPLPDPETMTTRAAGVVGSAGESVARAAAEPLRQAVDPRATTPPAGATAAPPREEPPADLRPGDVVRLIGFLPNKLREALAALDAGAAGAVLDHVDALLHGTATTLRAVRDRLAAIDAAVAAALDAALAPVTAAQVDAQLALEGSAVLSAEGFDATASFALLVDAGPAGLQLAVDGETRLVGERAARARGALVGAAAADLDAAADLLDALLPGDVTRDLDALLAALDPEPIAAELDLLLAAVVDLMPGFLDAAEAELRDLEARIRRLIDLFNPGALALRFLAVLDVVREEMAVLDPGRLADELGEVHAQIRAAVQAWDPRALAADLDGLLADVAAALAGLDPAGLVPDLSGITAQAARIGDILPVNALAGVGGQLEAVGAELRALDLDEMIAAVNALGPEVADAIALLVEAVQDELIALLESIRYATGSASVSVSASTGGST